MRYADIYQLDWSEYNLLCLPDGEGGLIPVMIDFKFTERSHDGYYVRPSVDIYRLQSLFEDFDLEKYLEDPAVWWPADEVER